MTLRARTFVSFEADFPMGGEPPGLELAQFVSSALNKAGIIHIGPLEREGWAWNIHSNCGATNIECIVGLSDDGPRQWQIHTYGHLGIFGRLSSRRKEQREVALQTFCQVIDHALKADQRFRTIRWYNQNQFALDHGDTWDHTP